MKKLFFALLSLGIVTTAAAQSGLRYQDYTRSDKPYIERSHRMMSKKESEINRINAKYDRKLNRIHRNPLMSPLVKLTRIAHIKKVRNAEIAKVNSKYARWERDEYSRR
jgi:hypothetical protein